MATLQPITSRSPFLRFTYAAIFTHSRIHLEHATACVSKRWKDFNARRDSNPRTIWRIKHWPRELRSTNCRNTVNRFADLFNKLRHNELFILRKKLLYSDWKYKTRRTK